MSRRRAKYAQRGKAPYRKGGRKGCLSPDGTHYHPRWCNGENQGIGNIYGDPSTIFLVTNDGKQFITNENERIVTN